MLTDLDSDLDLPLFLLSPWGAWLRRWWFLNPQLWPEAEL
jgi:hypothetical protein